jgi:hypothetical protein
MQQLCRIFTTNTVYVPHLNGIGLFPIIPLLDHRSVDDSHTPPLNLIFSCKENCFYECVGERIVVTPIVPVAKDQPLTLNFATSYMPRAHRQAEIRNLFGYDCACDLCSASKDDTRAFVCKKVCLSMESCR